MTENLDNVGDENTEEMSDEAAAKLVDWSSLGIDLYTTPFSKLVEIYNARHAIVKTLAEAKKDGKSSADELKTAVNKRFASSAADSAACDTVVAAALTAFKNLYEVIDFFGPGAAYLVEGQLKKFTGTMKDEVGYWTHKFEQDVRTEQNIVVTDDEEASAARIDCQGIRSLIETRVVLAKLEGKDIPADLYNTSGERTTLNVPKLPKSASSAPVGRSAKLRHMEYVVSTTDGRNYVYPAGTTTLGDIAHNLLSKGAVRTTRDMLEDMLAKQGIKSVTTKEWWTIVTTFGTVCGRISPDA